MKKGTAGNYGDAVRSDCLVTVEVGQNSGIEIQLESKVESLYGKAIRKLCRDMFSFFGVEHAKISIRDQGALEFVMAARIEAALKQVFPTEKEYLLPFYSEKFRQSTKDDPRRSRLYIPGNTPKLMINAGIHGADAIILDLEDSVAPDKKPEARFLVRNALRTVDFGSSERMVRINQLPAGLEDLSYIVPHQVNLILIPKCESAEQIHEVETAIAGLTLNINRNIHLMPIIESGLGVVNAHEIASASDSVVALAIGLEDYTADLGVRRTLEGTESLYARASIVNAAAASGIQAIDSVFSDVGDVEGLKENIMRSKALGFSGMGCIHPRQVAWINVGYNPEEVEIAKAKSIVLAWEEAKKKKQGVISLGSKMIDLPVAKRALRTIDIAQKNGLVNENWREEAHD